MCLGISPHLIGELENAPRSFENIRANDSRLELRFSPTQKFIER
ncbi:hypothetical protein RSSM_04201 [Rhodopirellula sallentina SM41]|uniref:Uncharacterized protein n=1 Tax=Rhodopirellula sallentina SM41 TaxID=1263870 RepID=M5U942_9BACT|nr:hypothetical protein RSSM_04201 [Rhodopirellula sallentina SM41]